MLCVGFNSIVFLAAMYCDIVESRRAWAFMIRSMWADQPYSPVTSEHGEPTIRSEMTTFSTFEPRISFTFLQSDSYEAFSSSAFFFSSSDKPRSRPSLVAHIMVL